MTKYAALTDYLKSRTEDEFVLTFEEIAHIISGYLPKSAERAKYWENAATDAHMQAGNKASQQAGYKTYLVYGRERVRFVRA
jgi:hypothetical protein